MEFFQVQELGDGIFCLKDLSTVEMYLVVGEQRAALLDTGTGIGDLAGAVRGLTNKPVEVYLTHGHVDHAGGIYSFDRVHVHPADKALMQENARPGIRLAFAGFVGRAAGSTPWTQADFAPPHPIEICELEPGSTADLGGRTLTAVDMAGHTRGSLGYFDSATGTLFAGDGCNNSTFLFLPESASVEEYRDTLVRLKADWGAKVRRMMICHDYTCIPLQCIDEVLACCENVLAGASECEPFVFGFTPLACKNSIWAARGGARRVDGRFGNLAYDTNRKWKYGADKL